MNFEDVAIITVGAVIFLATFLIVPILATMEINKIIRGGSRAWLDEVFGDKQ